MAKYFLLLVFWCAAQTSSATPANDAEMGQLEMTTENGQKQTALLLDTRVQGEVNGLLASITIEQSFSNQSNDWMHGRYVFPLPEMAAVNELEIRIGERVITGEVQEKQQAKRTFEAAKKSGKKAGLVEQHRANLFSVNLANIAPGEKITTKLVYVDRVVFSNNLFELRLPTTLTPRYISGQPKFIDGEELGTEQAVIDLSHGWASATNAVPDAANITPPQAHNLHSESSHHFGLELNIDPGLATNGIISPSHKVSNAYVGTNAIAVSLTNNRAPLDRDLVLQWQARDQSATQAALFQHTIETDNGPDYYHMVMVMPPQLQPQARPRDVSFIVDTSGSMGGTSIEQAKKALLLALQHLSVNDRFNIIEFNSRFTTLFGQSAYATANNILKAQRLVMGLGSGGGTEMARPLSFAMQQPSSDEVLKQIIFITDGSVGNEAELFKIITEELGDARLFTVAIGSAPNNYFMRKAARFGRGFYLNISSTKEVSDKIEQLSRRIQQPVMQNVRVDWPENVEQFPAKLPDLYAGEPLVLVAKSTKPITSLSVSGEMQEQRWQQKLQLGNSAGTPKAERLNTLWARTKIEDLMDSLLVNPEQTEPVKAAVIKLGIEHHLLTKFTSFVAVEQKIARPEDAKPKHENVPNLMPAGSTMLAPNTATPSALLQIMGSLLMLIALLIHKAPSFRWPSEIA